MKIIVSFKQKALKKIFILKYFSREINALAEPGHRFSRMALYSLFAGIYRSVKAGFRR